MAGRIGGMREDMWESGGRKKESDMIAKMKHAAVRTFRSPSLAMTTSALVAMTAGAAFVGCEKGKMSPRSPPFS